MYLFRENKIGSYSGMVTVEQINGGYAKEERAAKIMLHTITRIKYLIITCYNIEKVTVQEGEPLVNPFPTSYNRHRYGNGFSPLTFFHAILNPTLLDVPFENRQVL